MGVSIRPHSTRSPAPTPWKTQARRFFSLQTAIDASDTQSYHARHYRGFACESDPAREGRTAVRYSNPSPRLATLIVVLAAVASSTARADPITQNYTVTDLGTYSSMFTPPASFAQPYAPVGYVPTASFPLAQPAPPSYGPSDPTYAYVQGVSLYPNGVALATEILGVNDYRGGDFVWTQKDIYYALRNANGSWSQPMLLMQSIPMYGTAPGPFNDGVSFSKSGGFLEVTAMQPGTSIMNAASVYNLYTKTDTNLATLPAFVNNGYSNLIAIGIDGQGRVWGYANHFTPGPNGGSGSFVQVLFTPVVQPSNPVSMDTPEPGSWVVMAVAMAGLAAGRLWNRRLRS